ncbi:MAG: hypothetical protein C0597_11460, partial [Marinilabiliales bacterium]
SDSKLLATESLNTYWNYNKQSLINYMKESLYGIRGIITNSCNEPLDAMIWVIGHDEENDSSMVFTDPVVGDYQRLIEPGSYDVVASAEGYINDTVFSINVAKGNTNWINFMLTSKDDSILLKTNKETVEDTLFFDEISIQQLIIYNDSNAINTDYSIELETEETWVDINKATGTIYLNKNDTIQVRFYTDLLTAGYYYNNILITSADCIIDTIPIHLVVKDTISSEITPKQIIDTLWAGENAQYEIIIKNNGMLSLNYNILKDPISSWLSLNKVSGNLPITECDTLTATINTQGYGFGELNCSLIVEKENSTSDTLAVSIFVKDTIEYTIYPESIADTLKQDTVVVYNLIVENTGYGNLKYTTNIVFPTKSNDFWVSTTDTVGVISSENKDTIKVNLNTSNLNSGDYICALWFYENSGKETLIPINIHIKQVQSIESFSNIQNVRLYPNPFKDDLTLECHLFEPEDITLSIYNTYGSLLFRKVLAVNNNLILLHMSEIFNIHDLSKAIYLIQISTDMNQTTLKVIKN